mmetsp:Transcript_60605/g.198227  ORF Transcript_60605/g.198227 Transcript_60605/m.198227 type:complete len:380 (-) Transcript_60605:46-1185(-)
MLEPLGPVDGSIGPCPGVDDLGPLRGSYDPAVEVDTEYEEGEEGEDGPSALPSPAVGRQGGKALRSAEVAEVEEELEESTTADADEGAQGDYDNDYDSRYDSRGGSRPVSATSSGGGGAARSTGRGSSDYSVPAANKEVWKAFGCNTEAGRALRRLYKGGGQADAASLVAYPRMPSPSSRWEPKPAARKPCPQRASVKVPGAARREIDRDDPKNWRMPLPGRKTESQIRAEMEAAVPERPNLPKGRDQHVEKQQLQDRFQFCGGRAMPKGAMGYVEASAALPKKVGPGARERLDQRRRRDENGMNAEQREICEELMLGIKSKQERLTEIEAEEAAETVKTKATTARNKEALELRNDIDRNLKDIDKVMEIAEAEEREEQ